VQIQRTGRRSVVYGRLAGIEPQRRHGQFAYCAGEMMLSASGPNLKAAATRPVACVREGPGAASRAAKKNGVKAGHAPPTAIGCRSSRGRWLMRRRDFSIESSKPRASISVSVQPFGMLASSRNARRCSSVMFAIALRPAFPRPLHLDPVRHDALQAQLAGLPDDHGAVLSVFVVT
jgi:hypothetical protein